jgi:hypothetical protein
MNILVFSSLLIVIILLIHYFRPNKTDNGIKLLIVFGIVIGIFGIGFNYLTNSSFGASTPIDITTENQTNQNLRIYAITFWKDNWNGNGNYVNYDSELKPNGISEFCIDNDGGEFWLVAKNKQGEIKYLEIVNKSRDNYNFKITEQNNIEVEKVLIAGELTFKTDKSEQFENYLVWINLILIGILLFNIINIKNK